MQKYVEKGAISQGMREGCILLQGVQTHTIQDNFAKTTLALASFLPKSSDKSHLYAEK